MQTSTESPAHSTTRQSRSWFGPTFLLLIIAVNVSALLIAWQDQSYLAFFIAVMHGPIANGVLFLIGLLRILFLKSREPPYSFNSHMGLTLGLPILFIFIDYFIILSMDLKGC